MNEYLILSGKKISYREILQNAYSSALFSAHEIHSLNFCRDWLQGKPSFIFQTSGSSGEAKVIEISRQQMQASAMMTAKALGLQKNDSTLICINTAYIGGSMMLVRTLELALQATLIAPSTNPFLDLFSLDENKNGYFDFLSFVPLQMQAILEDSPKYLAILNKAKAIIIGGAAVNYTLEQKIQAIKVPVYSTYGMTETVSHIALKCLNTKNKSDYFEILERVEIATDERNCLKIKAPLTLGKWIQTNDLVKITDNKHFIWLGRADNVINSGGIKVQVEKIEKQLDKILSDLKINYFFFAAGLPDEKLGEKVVLCFEGKILDKNMEKHILEELRKTLNRYEMPKEFIYFKKFQKTPTEKIDRKNTLKNLRN